MIVLGDTLRRVTALKQRQGSSGIFGADKHQFRLRPHSSEEVARLERHLGVKLPDSYSQFLLQVGSGAGPYYGIYSADELLENLARIQTYLAEEQSRPCPAKGFAFGHRHALEAQVRLREKAQQP